MSPGLRAAALVVGLLLAGCVRQPNGPPPDPRQFVLGETTEAQVLARLGEPQQRSERVFPLSASKDHPAGRIVTASLTYGAFVIRGALLEGGTTFAFRDGLLNGYQIGVNNQPGFGGFDFGKVRALLADKATTRSDVVAILGDPKSRVLIGSSESDRYVFNVPVGFGTNERIIKTVAVIYDRGGHVISYDLNETRR